MDILLRITTMAFRYRKRMVLAYLSFFIAIGFSLMIPWLFGESIDALVVIEGVLGEGGQIMPNPDLTTGLLAGLAAALLAASIMRGFFDFARTYTTDSLSQAGFLRFPQLAV